MEGGEEKAGRLLLGRDAEQANVERNEVVFPALLLVL